MLSLIIPWLSLKNKREREREIERELARNVERRSLKENLIFLQNRRFG